MVNALTSVFEGSQDELTFKLKAGSHKESELAVSSFVADEPLSELFSWRIDVAIDPDATPTLDDAIGEEAEFQILRDGKPERIVHGIVGEVAPLGPSGKQRVMAITLVPKLAELQYVTNTRIFQELAVNEIVEQIFKPLGIEPYWLVGGRPPKRDYRVQQNENDYDFFRRILADEGIHFYFVHDDKGTKVQFANDPKGYPAIDGDSTLPYSDIGGAVTVDHVASVAQRRGLRPGSVVMRDYDFETPGKDLEAKDEVKGQQSAENAARREVFIYPGDYTDKTAGKTLAQRRLEEARSTALVLSGRSSCVQLEVGRKFTLKRHPDDAFNRDWTITGIKVRGARAGVLADTGQSAAPGFSVSFSAVPCDINNPRPRRRPQPAAHPESAVVVGPNTGSPFVDKYGRVKVQFHWDRQGKKDEHSSCWLRVMTPAAGGGRGIWFPPRVGDEVIVQHIDGDLDRPFVAGAIYNGGEMQPNALPDQSAKSTIKTLTIPATTKGSNELTFTDTAGAEEIYLHAQKDRRTAVLHNHNETVGANQSVTVGANQSITVGANRTVTVGANETTSIAGHRKETVDTGEDVTIQQGRTVEILSGNETLEVTTGNREVKVNLKDTFHSQSKEDTIDTKYDIAVGTSITIHHGGDATLVLEAGKASLTTSSEITISNPSGSITLAGGKVQIAATNELVLGAGTAVMSFTNDGSIGMRAPTKIEAASAASFLKLEPPKATLSGPMTDVVAKAIAKVMGALVKIN